jgi:hypothetical protein
MQLDDLLTAAFFDLTRLNRIRECSLQLKSLGVELNNEQRISSALQAAIEAGVPKEETEPFARRLREVETRFQLQRAMEAKDIPTLEQAIQSAEKRLAKNEMEVRWESSRHNATTSNLRFLLKLTSTLVDAWFVRVARRF